MISLVIIWVLISVPLAILVGNFIHVGNPTDE